MGLIATVVFTPRKESQKAAGSIHVDISEKKISEWAKLQRTYEFCQMLIKRIGQPSQEAKSQARLEADKRIGSQVELDNEYKDKVRNQMNQGNKEYLKNEADQEVRSEKYIGSNGSHIQIF